MNFKNIVWFTKAIVNKTIIRFGFCDIQNNQGLDKGYQPDQSQSSASTDNPRQSTLIILDITKTSSNNCLKFCFDKLERQLFWADQSRLLWPSV